MPSSPIYGDSCRPPAYKDKTTLIVSTDHGRGSGPDEWKDHGTEQEGSENIWIAVLGPDTPPLGERRAVAAVTQAQIAATIAALVGEDFRAFEPAAAPSLPQRVRSAGKVTARSRNSTKSSMGGAPDIEAT